MYFMHRYFVLVYFLYLLFIHIWCITLLLLYSDDISSFVLTPETSKIERATRRKKLSWVLFLRNGKESERKQWEERRGYIAGEYKGTHSVLTSCLSLFFPPPFLSLSLSTLMLCSTLICVYSYYWMDDWLHTCFVAHRICF